ncbi:hypothetical protein U0070_004283, partial [Myodes glareolus]
MGIALGSSVLTPRGPAFCLLSPGLPRGSAVGGVLTVRVSPAHPSPAHLRNPRPPRERGPAHD